MASRVSPRPWYEAKGDIHKEVSKTVRFIQNQLSEQRRDLIHFAELYSAGNVAGLGTVLPGDRLQDYLYALNGDVRFNMASAVVDTAASMIGSSPAVPVYMSSGASFSIIRRAEKRSKVLQGQFNNLVQDLAGEWLLDACKMGTGILHTYLDEDGCTAVERVHPLEILVEHADGLYCAPRSMHRVRLISKEVLKAQFPHKASAIDACGEPHRDAVSDFFLSQTSGDRSQIVEVWESHHLAPKKGGKGRHTICIENATLEDEKYEHTDHPYVVLRYRKRDFGFFGAGLIESCRAAQNRVNDLIARVTRAQDLGSNLVVLNPNGQDSVKVEQLTNEIGLVIGYNPVIGPPQVVKWDGTLDDLQEQIDLEFQRALVVEGLSSEQVNGDGAGKGLTSGVAVRAADDVQSRRLVAQIKRFQQANISLAKAIERCNDDALALSEDYEVRSSLQQGGQTFLTTSKWADLVIPKGQADVVMMPMSALPTTPQGKWAAAMEWIEAGFTSKQYAMKLLQFPDLDAYASIELAHLDLAQWQIDKCLDAFEDDWEQVLPNPRQDLTLALDLFTKSQMKALTMNAPPEVIDALESFMVYAEDLLKKKVDAANQNTVGSMTTSAAPQGVPVLPAPGPLGLPTGPAMAAA